MPTLITETRLKEAVAGQTFVRNGDVRSVEGIKVDLHLGDSVLKAQYGQPVSLTSRAQSDTTALQIDPGEVVFVLTREELHLGSDMMATLSPKRTLAHSGIVVLGGLAVDPGYKGVLWLGLYNLSTTAYVLLEGRKLISAFFYKLSEEESAGVTPVVSEEPVRGFPEQLIELIAKYRPVELKGLQEELEDTRRDLSNLRREITDDRTWREEFKKSLEAHNQQIADLLRGLDAETSTRKAQEAETQKELTSIRGMFQGLRSWRSATLTVGALIIGALLAWAIPKIFDHEKSVQPPPPPYYYPYPYPSPLGEVPPATSATPSSKR